MGLLAAAPRAALEAGAASTPESPLLFYRNRRGEFGWWSWAAARDLVRGRASVADDVPGALAARDWLEAVLGIGEAERGSAAHLLAALPASPRRRVWLTVGDLERPVERVLAVAALAGRWAVVHEPGPALHAATFAWARPTLVGGPADDLLDLLDAIAALAPRWRPDAWTARRLRRLDALVVGPGERVDELAERVRAVGARAVVLSISRSGW